MFSCPFLTLSIYFWVDCRKLSSSDNKSAHYVSRGYFWGKTVFLNKKFVLCFMIPGKWAKKNRHVQHDFPVALSHFLSTSSVERFGDEKSRKKIFFMFFLHWTKFFEPFGGMIPAVLSTQYVNNCQIRSLFVQPNI